MDDQNLFRKKAAEKISSPEQLSDYLKVTSPGVWLVLTSVMLLLLGLFIWASVGTVESTKKARAVVTENTAELTIIVSQGEQPSPGMPVYISGEEYELKDVSEDAYGRWVAHADVALPDGSYDADVVTERIKPVLFLLESSE